MPDKKTASEFFDLSEHRLNGESGFSTHWGNFGYWENAFTYPEACQALATLAGDAAGLNHQTHLLDLGFGSGEQVLYWFKHYRIARYTGINISKTQTQFAREKIRTTEWIHHEFVELRHEDASKAAEYEQAQGSKFNSIIALDCAYHFQNRRTFFETANGLLDDGGRLVLTDFCLHQRTTPITFASLNIAARASRIPRRNLISRAQYRDELMEAGFSHVEFMEITPHVFEPFKAWFNSYKKHYPTVSAGSTLKYEVISRYLSWASKPKGLHYYVVTAEK